MLFQAFYMPLLYITLVANMFHNWLEANYPLLRKAPIAYWKAVHYRHHYLPKNYRFFCNLKASQREICGKT